MKSETLRIRMTPDLMKIIVEGGEELGLKRSEFARAALSIGAAVLVDARRNPSLLPKEKLSSLFPKYQICKVIT